MRVKAIAGLWKKQVKKHLFICFFPMDLYIKTGIKAREIAGSPTVKISWWRSNSVAGLSSSHVVGSSQNS